MRRHWMAMAASICALAVIPSTALAREVGQGQGTGGQQVSQSQSGSNKNSAEQSASSETSSTPATVGASSAARPPGVHAKQPSDAGRRPEAHGRRRREAARAAGPTVEVLLAPGAGYQRARGSERVRALQRKLARLGFAPGPIDGRYGPLTTGAVDRFQAAADLTPGGVSGPHTMAALSATPQDALFPGAGYRLARGSERVRALQRTLTRLGLAPGPIDGRYGPVTTKAVERFQGSRGLRVDGIVGAQTLGTLRGLARPRTPAEGHSQPRPDSQLRPAPKAVRVLHERRRVPVLPLLPLLLGFAALGLATMSFGYAQTRARVARARAPARAARAPTAPVSPSLVRGVGAKPRRHER
jgi:peptidoglycan hydrolase-like protein with peptidoglycan-binding domain